MRKRSKALTTLAAFGLIGGVHRRHGERQHTRHHTGRRRRSSRRRRRRQRQRQRHRGLPTSPAPRSRVFGVENVGRRRPGAMQAALNAFADANGMTITYTGSRDFEGEIGTMVEGGSPPDIAIVPAARHASPGSPASGDAPAAARRRLGHRQRELGPARGWRSATSTAPSTACRSRPTSSRSCGTSRRSSPRTATTVPTTFDDFFALTDQMIADGDTPLCVGIESGPATGWPFTDWVEELVLRNQGIDYYNQWVDPRDPVQLARDRRGHADRSSTCGTADGMVYADGGTSQHVVPATTPQPLVDGDCMMHRQASFFAAFFPAGTAFGDGRRARCRRSTSRRPQRGPSDAGRRHQPGGVPRRPRGVGRDAVPRLAGVRQRPPDGTDGARRRRDASGFLTANLNADQSLYSPLEQQFLEVLATGSTRPASTPPTRCPTRSDPARSGRKRRRSSTATRTPRRPPTTSRPPGRRVDGGGSSMTRAIR